MKKILQAAGVLGVLLLSSLSLGSINTVYANNQLESTETAEEYVPELPTSDIKQEQSKAGNVPSDIVYPAYKDKNGYSLNPNTKPTRKLDQDTVDTYIEKLSECSYYNANRDICVEDRFIVTGGYALKVDTSYDSGSFDVDLMALANEIEKKTGVETLVYTDNHYTNSTAPKSQILVFTNSTEMIDQLINPQSTITEEEQKTENLAVMIAVPSVIIIAGGLAVFLTRNR